MSNNNHNVQDCGLNAPSLAALAAERDRQHDLDGGEGLK